MDFHFGVEKRNKKTYFLFNKITGNTFIVPNYYVEILLEILSGKNEAQLRRYFSGVLQDKKIHTALEFLDENHFLDEGSSSVKFSTWKWVSSIPHFLLGVFFVFFLVVSLFGVYSLFTQPVSMVDFFLFDGFFFVLFFYLSWIPLTLLHEAAHFLVASYFKTPARIFFKFIFIYPALVTEVPFDLALDRKKRILIHSAGILSDLFFMGLFRFLGLFFFKELFTFFYVMKLFGIITQFYVHLRTDLYFIIEDLFSEVNLKRNAILAFRKLRANLGIKLKYLIFFMIIVFGYFVNVSFVLFRIVPTLSGYMGISTENRLVVLSFLFLNVFYKITKIIRKRFYMETHKDSV